MAEIPFVSLAADAVAISTTPGTIGPSSALTQDADYLVIAMGHARTTGGLGAYADLNLTIDDVVFARYSSSNVFGTPTNGALGGPQLGCAFTYTPAANDHVIEVDHVAEAAGEAESVRVYALDLSLLPEGDGRWHSESANDDTIVTTPSSGYTTIGGADSGVLVFTPPRSGSYLIIASCEAVANGSAAATEEIRIRTRVDGAVLSGSTSERDMPTTPNTDVDTENYLYARVVSLTAGVESTIDIQAQDSNGAHVGYRRIRVHALEVAAFEQNDVQQDTDTDGETTTGTGTFEVSGIAITLNPPASRDFLLLAFAQCQLAFYAEHHFLLGGSTEQPTNGFGTGVNNNVTTTPPDANDDMPMFWGVYVTENVASSTALAFRMQRLGGSVNNRYGATCQRASAGDIVTIAIRLALKERGPLDVTLPALELAADGIAAHVGEIASALPAPVLAAEGVAAHTGELDATLPVPVAAFAGVHRHSATLAATLPVLTLAADGIAAHTGDIDIVLPALVLAAVGGPPIAITGETTITHEDNARTVAHEDNARAVTHEL